MNMADPIHQRDDNPYLRRIRQDIHRMPSLSTTVNKVLTVCNRLDPSPHDLNRIIELDPVLTGRVLKLVNSAYFALWHQVNSVTHAIILLGINTIKNLALSVAILGKFRDRRSFRAFSTNHFWEHSLAVAVIAKLLGRLKDRPRAEQEELFVAGLLHDIGKIPLNRHFPAEYDTVIRLSTRHEQCFSRAETDMFGFDHATVGQLIAAKWCLNPQLENAIARHHCVDVASKAFQLCTGIVCLADAIANELQLGLIPGQAMPVSGGTEVRRRMQRLAIDPDAITGLQASLRAEVEKAEAFLELTRGD
jgi:putative nucleotidyltransferase with HDIG domain